MKKGATLAILVLAVIGASAALLAGAWSASAAPEAPEAPGDARVRVAHASPDAPNVDVWVDGSPAFTDVAFEEVTSYAALPAGAYLVQVEPAGSGGAGPFVISSTITVTAGTDYTVAAVDELASIEALVLEDDNAAPAPGDAHVRFVHASPDAPAVDITLPDGTPIFSNVAFKGVGAYTPVAAGSYDLEVRPTGTMTSVLDLDGVSLSEGTVYTVFATGYAGGGTPALNAVIAEDAGQARVRVAHTSPDAPNVDVWVNGTPAFTDVAFEEVTSYAALPSQDYLIQVEPAGSGGAGPFVISTTVSLEPNSDYTIAAVDELASIEALVLEDDNTAPAPGDAHVRFVHASPNAPAVDITLPDGTPIFSNVAFKGVGAYTPVAAGSYDLEVRPTGTMTSVLDLMGISLSEGTVYTVFATGYAGGGTPALNAILVEDAGEARVRVAHMSPDAPNVDVWVDGTPAFTDVAFEEVSDYAALPSNSYFVEVVPAGATSPVVISATLNLEPNTDYTVVALDELASIEPLVLEDDNWAPAVGDAHVRFVHASPDAPAVDITLPDGTPVFSNIAFKGVGDYTPVMAGIYDLEVRPTGTMTSVLDLDGVPLREGTTYTVFASGYAGGGTPALNAVLVADAEADRMRMFLPSIARE